MHRLEYILKGREATAIRGVMHFDLGGVDLLSVNDYTRIWGLIFEALRWTGSCPTRCASGEGPCTGCRQGTSAQLGISGLLELELRTPPGRFETLEPKMMILRFLPMGRFAGVDNHVLGITAQTANGERIPRGVTRSPRTTRRFPAWGLCG